MVYILPYIEQTAISNNWQHTSSSGYTNANNMSMINNKTIPTYRCPATVLRLLYSNAGGYTVMMTTYVGSAGDDTAADCRTGGPNVDANSRVSSNGLLFPNSKAGTAWFSPEEMR